MILLASALSARYELDVASPVDIRCDPSEYAAPGKLPRQADGHVLLVSRSPEWEEAVRAAVSQVAGSKVVACSPRQAVAKLASGDLFSFLLLEAECADGLQDTLTNLTGAHAYSRTSLIMLGGVHPPHVRAIRLADPTLIHRALAAPVASTETGSHGVTSMPISELRAAIRTTMMEARYQPIVRLADRAAVSVEALARLNHPAFGTVLPDYFVPRLEEAGFGAGAHASCCHPRVRGFHEQGSVPAIAFHCAELPARCTDRPHWPC